MEPTVYVETSIISYLTAKASRDLIAAARQQTTMDWWARRRPRFRVHASELVIAESRSGDPDAVARRMAALQPLPILGSSGVATELATALVSAKVVPTEAGADALHIAIAAANGMD